MAYRPYIWKKNNPEKSALQKRRGKIRRKLRDRGYLPPVGILMTEKEQKIYKQIGNNDYSFWDSVKLGAYTWNGYGQRTLIKSPEYRIWYRAKDNAKKRNFEFNLDIEDIIIPDLCPYLDVPLITDFNENHNNNYYSIDRIDSKKGYIKGNVQIISNLANTMKNSATKEQLFIFAKNVLKMS